MKSSASEPGLKEIVKLSTMITILLIFSFGNLSLNICASCQEAGSYEIMDG